MPTPSTSLPPESRSKVAACLATITGCRNPITSTQVASRIRSVIPATYDR